MTRIITIFCILFALSVSADTVWTKDGKVLEGSKITLELKKSRLLLDRRPIKLDSIAAIDAPMPGGVAKMASYYYSGNFAPLLKSGDKLVQSYKYLGWGHKAAYYYSMALLKSGNADKAYEVAALSKQYITRPPADEAANTNLSTLALVYYSLLKGETKKAGSRLKSVRKYSDSLGAFFYNAQAAVYKKQGLENSAVLEYYKSIFLDKANLKETVVAVKEAVAILGEDDPRAKYLINLKN